MGNFQCNSIEDLVFNRSFRDWVLLSGTGETEFWENWIKHNPDKASVINQSKAIIYALQLNLKALPDELVNTEISKILQKLNTEEPYTEDEADTAFITANEMQKPGFISKKVFRFLAAAAIAGLIITSVFLSRNAIHTHGSGNYESFVSAKKVNAVERVNNTDSTQIITLPDGSTVHLEKQSKLSYAQQFTGIRREVFLTGAAFFEVQKNPSRPFLVYTNNIITKVLGTSFRVKAYTTDKKAVITVRTGKVFVFKAQNFNVLETKESPQAGLLVTPNQEVVYNPESNELNKKITELPLIIAAPPAKAFLFEATPVRQVFKIMQDTYNVPIVYDEDIMAGCSLSASLGNESFYEKLNLICRAIDATYEMIDGQIVIISKGCGPHH